MALGSNYQDNKGNYNNQNSAPMTNPTYYSRLRIRNFDTKMDINFQYWNGTLVVIIQDSSNGGTKGSELAKINLSPNKAKILADCLQTVIDEKDSSTVYGVDTGFGESRGLFAVGRDTGIPFILIGKVDKNGNFESSQRYVFAEKNHYTLQFSDLDNLKFIKNYDDSLELIQLRDILKDFARSSNGAYAYNTQDINRYELGRLTAMVRGIMQSTNAKPVYNNSNSNRSGESFFNNDNSGSSNNGGSLRSNNDNPNKSYQKIDDLENELLN